MAELNLPTTPSDGQEVTHENTKFIYSASKNVWTRQTLNTRFEHVVPTTNTSLTSTAISGSNLVFTKADGSTSNVSLTAMASGQVRVFATESALPTTTSELTAANIQPGEHALVTQTDDLYIYAGGWRKIDSVNLTPSVTASISSKSFTPAETIDITYTINEPEGTPVTVTTSNTGISNTDQVSIAHYTGNNTVTVTAGQSGLSGGILSINATDGTNIGSASITLDVNVGFDSGVFLQHQWGGSDQAQYGANATLSDDGKYLAISSLSAGFGGTNDESDGKIDIWVSDGSTNSWTHQVTIDHNDFNAAFSTNIDNENNNTFGRFKMQLNADGSRLLVANPYASVGGQLSRGTLALLSRSGTTWSFVPTTTNGHIPLEPTIEPRQYMYAGEQTAMANGIGNNNGQVIAFAYGREGNAGNGYQSGQVIQIHKHDLANGKINNTNFETIDFLNEPNNNWIKSTTRAASAMAFSANGEWLAVGFTQTHQTGATFASSTWNTADHYRGALYFYKSTNPNTRTDYTQQQYIMGPVGQGKEFGARPMMSNNGTLISTQAQGDHTTIAGATGVGKVFIHTLSGNTWSELQVLQAPTTGAGSDVGTGGSQFQNFGHASAISGDASYIAIADSTEDESIEAVQ